MNGLNDARYILLVMWRINSQLHFWIQPLFVNNLCHNINTFAFQEMYKAPSNFALKVVHIIKVQTE